MRNPASNGIPRTSTVSDTARFFSPDYRTARQRFCAAARAAGAALDTLPLAAKGPHGDELAIDVAWFGERHPRRAFVHSSGLHGVEGFAGSAIQLQWLAEGVRPPPADGAIALAHMLNPYGAAWLRRVNENNVDLNRNFGAVPSGDTEAARAYRLLDPLLNPPSPPRIDFFLARAAWQVLRHGMTRLRDSVIGGQTVNPHGLFFAGTRMQAGPAAYEALLESRLAGATRVVALDVHTGYGRYGEDALMANASPARAHLNRCMLEAFGDRLALADGSNVAYHVAGSQQDMYTRMLPNAEVYFATQEFGTIGALRVLAALRAENRWHHHGSGAFEHEARRDLLAAFCPEDERWRDRVLERGRAALTQAFALAFAQ